MNEKESAYREGRTDDLQKQIDTLREHFLTLSSALSEFRRATMSPVETATSPQLLFPGPPQPFPLIFAPPPPAGKKHYATIYFPEGRVEYAPCGKTVAQVDLPQTGSYYLMVNNSGKSDCSVIFEDSNGAFSFRPVGPGESRGTRFFFDGGASLVARCRGEGQCTFTYQLLLLRPL